ncbi:MAG: DUF2095 family protein [Candidatus Lokiarchaeota archaeon]|nr:DUF2095 family protein [Candidatus Harpocratesius repetitus]
MQEKRTKDFAQISEDKLTIEYDLNDFNESLPNLAKELYEKKESPEIIIEGIRKEEKPNDPGVIDFIQRCKTSEEAFEIINFLEKQGEIDPKEANNLISQIKENGIRSFGPLKTYGHYERNFRNYH